MTDNEHEQMVEEKIKREIRSGWFRTLVTTLVGVSALAGSTYTVVANITEMRIMVAQNSKGITNNHERLEKLESKQLPDGLERGQLQAAIKSVQITLDKIERRMERLEELQRNIKPRQ